eukprot:9320078-Alexandrium_andersonii.AAC.1
MSGKKSGVSKRNGGGPGALCSPPKQGRNLARPTNAGGDQTYHARPPIHSVCCKRPAAADGATLDAASASSIAESDRASIAIAPSPILRRPKGTR